MTRGSDIRIVKVQNQFRKIELRMPIKFGGRITTALTLFEVYIDVETRDGRRGQGYGSMPLGNAWAWPGGHLDVEATLNAMCQFGQLACQAAGDHRQQGHPLEIILDLQSGFENWALKAGKIAGLVEPMPKLAQLNAASPIDAALHDAYGKALGKNCYDLLGPEYLSRDLSEFISIDFRGEYLDRYTLRKPKSWMPLYHLVGALDPLTLSDISSRLDDGLPEMLLDWIKQDNLTHLKIKLNGDDLKWDVARVVAINRVAEEAYPLNEKIHWQYSVDFNERCANVNYLLDFLHQVKAISPKAFQRIQYIEQPTHRDLRAHPENKMHEAAKIKPIVIDESLIDFESLMLSREMGYSGVALKTCKGHSKALLMGAAAQKYGMFVCVQDLTCPGASFLHSLTLAARVPTVAAIEGNARQYCPMGNQPWQEQLPSIFRPQNGFVESGLLDKPGIGF